MSFLLFSKGVWWGLGIVFLIGSVWSSYIYPITGWSLGSYYDLKRHLVIFFFLTVSLFIFLVREVRLVSMYRRDWFIVVLFFFIGGVAAGISDKPYWGGVELSNYGLLFWGFLILSSTARVLDRVELLRYLYCFILIFTLFLFVRFFLSLLFNLMNGNEPNVHQLISGFVNARFLNQLQVMLLPLLLLPFFLERLSEFKRVSILLIAFHWMVLFQTEARGAILSLIVSVFVVSFVVTRGFRVLLFSVLVRSALVGGGLWVIFILALPYLFIGETGFVFRTDTSGRLDMWAYILKEGGKSFWFGYGPMSFSWADGNPLNNAHPHNFVLQLLYEYGLAVAVILVIWGGGLLWNLLKMIKENRVDNERVILSVSIIAAVAYSFLSGVFVMPFSQLMFIAVLSLLYQSYGEVRLFFVRRFFFSGVLILVCLVLVSSYQHDDLIPNIYPRLWSDGQID